MDQQRKLVFKFWKIVDWDGSTEKIGFKVLEDFGRLWIVMD